MPPVLPKRPRLLNQRPSIGWFDLPLKIRETIIDSMDPKTRCRFVQCSTQCEEEANDSKNCVYSIGHKYNQGLNYSELCLSFSKESKRDYWYEFVDARTNQTVVIYKCNTTPFTDEGIVKWIKLESGKAENVRLEYLNENLDKYENSIKIFHFNNESTSWSDLKVLYPIKICNQVLYQSIRKVLIRPLRLDIRELKLLEELCLDGDVPYWENGIELKFIDMKQFSRIKILNTPTMGFTFDQFLTFTGEKAVFACIDDDFDEKGLLKYLKMRKNGEIHENLGFLQMIEALPDMEEFDIGALMVKLDGYDYSDDGEHSKYFSFRSNSTANREFCVHIKYDRDVKLWWKQTE